MGYSGNDGVRQHFTAKERDNETGLDYFGARYYSSMQGRFTSVDPYNIISRKEKGRDNREKQQLLYSYIAQPQVWNRYSYVLNSPCNNTDVGGKCSAPSDLKPGQTGICVEAFIAAKEIGPYGRGRGDNRSFSGDDDKLTARVRVQITISPNDDGKTHQIQWVTTTAKSEAVVAGISISRQGTSTVEIKNAQTQADGTVNFTLSVTGVNGFSGLPGAPKGEIALDVNFIVTPDGKVGTQEGSDSRTYPSIGIYGYRFEGDDIDGYNRITITIIEQPEKNLDDLTKPKQPLPTVPPR